MGSTADRWVRISAWFDELVELEPVARTARLAEISREDPTAAAELAALLNADAREHGLLEGGVAQAIPSLPVDAVSAMPADGRVGAYRLLRAIGEGGMGAVFLAKRDDDSYEQHVALKLIKPGMDSTVIVRRFLQERRILARLVHPNIVRLLDGGMSADGRPFYAMEYVDGSAITDYATQHQLAVRARVELVARVAEAVAYAHAQLIVHRDLKPSNVLVDTQGQPRVLDFGIAKVLEGSTEAADDGTLTATGARALSPAYAAPEQLLGEPVGTAADVYALGLMLCEVLTGRLPHRRRLQSAPNIAQEVDRETTERPSTLVTRASKEDIARLYGPDTQARALSRMLAGDLDVIASTALRRDPARRYATAAAFADDLRRWADQRPIAARADSAMYRTGKFIRRHRVGVAASVLVALSLVGGLGAAVWQARKALVAERQSREQADIATAVSDFLTRDVIQAVNPYRNTLDIRLVDALKAGGARIDARFAGNPRLIGIVRRELADSLYLAGETEPARAQAQLALDALQNAFGASDTDALRARVTLGRILHKQDEYEKSRAVYTEGLKAVAPSTPDDVRLAFPVGLAGLDMEDRHEAEAVEQLDKLIPEIEAKVGLLEQVHVDALDNQLRAYMGLERFDEGLAVARRLRSATEAKFGVGDPQTLEWLKREAIVLSNMDRNEDALPIMHKACDATQASLGNGHYATQDCNLRLGVILFNLSRFDEAALLFEPAVAYREKSQGNDSESTWLSWIWLARARQHTGRTNDARVLFERAQQNAVRVFGDGDAKALPFGQTLGMFLEQTGSHEDAERMRKKLLDQSRKALGEENIITAKMAWDLGETMASQQHDKDTVAFFEPWLPQWERLFGEKDDRVTDAKLWLSAARERLAIGAR